MMNSSSPWQTILQRGRSLYQQPLFSGNTGKLSQVKAFGLIVNADFVRQVHHQDDPGETLPPPRHSQHPHQHLPGGAVQTQAAALDCLVSLGLGSADRILKFSLICYLSLPLHSVNIYLLSSLLIRHCKFIENINTFYNFIAIIIPGLGSRY